MSYKAYYEFRGTVWNDIEQKEIDLQKEYIKKARKLCPPPEEIDFRMSEDDNEKYRVEE